ncbi:MAG: hypothetical protein ACTIJJ_07030 [Galactobacter sp.]
MIDVDEAIQAHQAIQDANRKGWWAGFVQGYTAACIDQADGIQPGPTEGIKARNRLWREYNTPAPVQFPQRLREAS